MVKLLQRREAKQTNGPAPKAKEQRITVMHALYFIGYAAMATLATVVIAQAQYSRMKTEGTPMSTGFLKAAAAMVTPLKL